MIERLFPKFYLWFNNHCTKHLIGRTSDGNGGSYCTSCEEEKRERREAKIAAAIGRMKNAI